MVLLPILHKEKVLNGIKNIEGNVISRIYSNNEIKERLQTYAAPYRELMSYYRCAMMEVSTKFNVLDEELSMQYDRNPIEAIKTRLKSPDSIMDKLSRRNLPISAESIEANLNDIAGVRVICAYISDIYMLRDALLRQDDITLLQEKDYIRNPKQNGYRSLHLIVEIPIFLHDKKKLMRVEVQFRTMAMDWWASVEHKLRYKKPTASNEVNIELKECAEISADLDKRLERLRQRTENYGGT